MSAQMRCPHYSVKRALMKRSRDTAWRVCAGVMVAVTLGGCPDDPEPYVPPVPENNEMRGDGVLGDPCEGTAACAAPMVCDRGSSRGYCRPPVCEVGCEELGGVCASVGGQPNLCWAECDGARDVQDGAKCIPSDATSAGLLAPADQIEQLVPFSNISESLGVVCESVSGPPSNMGPTRDFTFEVGASDSSFMVVNSIAGQGEFYPFELLSPDETAIDLVLDYRHHNARLGDMQQEHLVDFGRYGDVSIDWSLLFPYSRSREALVKPGTYTMRVATNDEDMCFYAIPHQGGTSIDLNFYFTNYGEFNAVHASDDDDFQSVIERVEAIYGQVGVKIGKRRYFNVPPEGRAYTVLRDFDDIKKLTALGNSPEPGRDGALSVDIFLVDTIAVPEGSLLGVSGGIPGPPGLHGNPGNGLVFGLDNLGINNKVVSHVMAHELGHYLGLRHTSEFVIGTDVEADFDAFLGVRDPLDDTVSCDDIMTLGLGCPDSGNLMFPAVPVTFNTTLIEMSEEQGNVIKANPLAK